MSIFKWAKFPKRPLDDPTTNASSPSPGQIAGSAKKFLLQWMKILLVIRYIIRQPPAFMPEDVKLWTHLNATRSWQKHERGRSLPCQPQEDIFLLMIIFLYFNNESWYSTSRFQLQKHNRNSPLQMVFNFKKMKDWKLRADRNLPKLTQTLFESLQLLGCRPCGHFNPSDEYTWSQGQQRVQTAPALSLEAGFPYEDGLLKEYRTWTGPNQVLSLYPHHSHGISVLVLAHNKISHQTCLGFYQSLSWLISCARWVSGCLWCALEGGDLRALDSGFYPQIADSEKVLFGFFLIFLCQINFLDPSTEDGQTRNVSFPHTDRRTVVFIAIRTRPSSVLRGHSSGSISLSFSCVICNLQRKGQTSVP